MFQQNFFEFARVGFGTTRTEILLEKINSVVPWYEIESDILINRQSSYGGVGRPNMNVIKLLKCLFFSGYV